MLFPNARQYLLILIVILLSNPSWSYQCRPYFELHNIKTQLTHFPISENRITPNEWIENDYGPPLNTLQNTEFSFTIRTIPKKTGDIYGQAFIIRKKSGYRWYSNYQKIENAAQGDPRTPLILLGTEVCEILGIRMMDAETIMYPTLERINWGIDILNAYLSASGKDLIPFKFYSQKNVEDASYLDNVNRQLLPIGTNDPYLMVHDIAYHLTKIMEPHNLVLRTQATLSLFNKYVDFIKENFPESYLLAERMLINFSDLSSANPTVAHYELLKTRGENTNAVLMVLGHPDYIFSQLTKFYELPHFFSGEESFISRYDHWITTNISPILDKDSHSMNLMRTHQLNLLRAQELKAAAMKYLEDRQQLR